MRSRLPRRGIDTRRSLHRQALSRRAADSSEEAAYELEEILNDMTEGLEKAGRILRSAIGVNDPTYLRAESYWMAAIKAALHPNVGHGTTMEDTINELRADGGEYEDEYRMSSQGNSIRPRVRIAR